MARKPNNSSRTEGSDLGDCENGGLENGNFDKWTARFGKRIVATPDDDLLIGTGFNPIHFSLVDGSLPEPNGIPIPLPFEGMFTFRMGVTTTGGFQEEATYCFEVDEDNKDFNFNYAIVLHDPKEDNQHELEELPYFEYKIFSFSNPLVPFQQLRVVADVTDPFFNRIGDDFAYKNLTCDGANLSDRIGEQVCITFRTAGCSLGDHFGYAYIDGLCNNDPEYNSPIVSLEANQTNCRNQSILLDASMSARYTSFQWEICVTPQGQAEECFSITGNEPLLEKQDLLDLIHEVNPGYVLSCPSQIAVTLTLGNECAFSNSEKLELEYICAEYDVDYKNLLLCSESVPNVDIPFEGVNTCIGCEYSWAPDYTLSNSGSAFPTIMGTVNENAFDVDYLHQTVSAEGCVYNDEIDILRITTIEPFVEDESLCGSRKLKGKVFFNGGLEFENLLSLNYHSSNSFPGILIEEESTTECLVYEFLEFPKTAASSGNIVATVSEGDYFLIPTEQCALSVPVSFDQDLTYFGDIRLKHPLANAFTPNGDNRNDTFGAQLPDGFSYGDENVVYGRMIVWQEWNDAIVYDSEDVFATNPNPFSYHDIRWDGSFLGGPPAVTGVFVFKIWLKNCTEGNTFHDGDPIAVGNVTLIR